MKGISLILSLLILVFSIENKKSYDEIFQEAYLKALDFIKINDDIITKELGDSTLKHLKIAIIFPELLKYSMYQDLLETAALELIYVNYGKESADFSIGYFQMKPSFIENLENEILNDSFNLAEYHKRFAYRDTSLKAIRMERIERLKSLKWQLKYLNLFYQYLSLKHKDIKWENSES